MKTSDDGRDVEKLDHSYIAGECVNWHSHSGKKVWQFLKLSMWLPSCNPGTVLWAFTTQEWKFVFMWYLGTNLYRSFVCILQKLKTIQISFKMCHVHTMDYYSAKKKKKAWVIDVTENKFLNYILRTNLKMRLSKVETLTNFLKEAFSIMNFVKTISCKCY